MNNMNLEHPDVWAALQRQAAAQTQSLPRGQTDR